MKKYILITFLMGSIGQTFGCQTFCENCKITQMEPHATGSTVVSFNSRTNDNPDNCGDVSKVIIDVNDAGSKELFSSMLSAFMAGKKFAAVRTCGCKDEWSTLWPKVGWVRINP